MSFDTSKIKVHDAAGLPVKSNYFVTPARFDQSFMNQNVR